jgi:uncharacterized LabA/DUF88 family protein
LLASLIELELYKLANVQVKVLARVPDCRQLLPIFRQHRVGGEIRKKESLMSILASHPVTAVNLSQRLGIFVDVQNMFYSAKQFHQGKIDYGRLLREITGQRQLIRAIAYIVQKSDINQDSFYSALQNLGYDLKIRELRARPDAEAKGIVAKGSWETGLSIDALSMAGKLDTIALVAGDGDYVPLAENLKLRGCRVEVYSFERSTASELIRAADQFIPIPESWLFKVKKFEGPVVPQTGHISYEGLPQDDDDLG